MSLPTTSSGGFDPSAFLEVADKVLDNMAIEKRARVRAAIGRAYYSLFLSTRQAGCRSCGKHIDSKVEHGALKDALFAGAARISDDDERTTVETLAKLLDELYAARSESDYRLQPTPAWEAKLAKPKTARSFVARTKAAIKRLDGMNLEFLDPHL
jgi:uncharacterized protein (UPF0332 family)